MNTVQKHSDAIQVMIVEDSITARTMLKMMLESAPDITVTDTARDPFDAVEKMKNGLPDVILLDIEMPRMDGLTFLRRIMSQHPLPVVICSNHTEAGSDTAMKALSMGAVEVMSKSQLGNAMSDEAKIQICDSVRATAQARVRPNKKPVERKPLVAEKKLSADVIMPPRPAGAPMTPYTDPIVSIGASTGGTDALAKVLTGLTPDCAPVVIVQHMPERFTEAFARRLDGMCSIRVKEAEDGDMLERGLALIAPGHSHVTLTRMGRSYRCNVLDGPYVCRHRPSVDVLFRSTSCEAGQNALGVLMTGMGDDGAQGMLEMRNAGSLTLAQDEASCVVYGMPREAVKRGAAVRSVALNNIAAEIMQFSAGASASKPALGR
ncbi:protein-glutamate methylesterase/protein-glutamine glutaminase [Donghicola eburneus]|uniref:protein-glutamate methylesterase/protein-glutamine glutaminase n=1 Tax=Donghicola eburneus TaxID=393278 RepID=UPI0008E08BFC|nr:chemotaxis response regulator protein-glutamate methylesterase [Donghicola eburneus]SFQ65390.1 two-component system, chemotaxis family, response regulator CheB [Donghicola eburneus]